MALSRGRAGVIVAASAVAGLVIGGGALAAASSGGDQAKHPAVVHQKFKVNSRGQTIGGLPTDGTAPDLIPVTLPSGVVGYIYASAVEPGAPAASPGAAVASQTPRGSQTQISSTGQISVNVYAIDGTTVIGTLPLGQISTTSTGSSAGRSARK